MKEEEFKELEKKYYTELKRRNEIDSMKNQIEEVDAMLEHGFKEDGYTSIDEMAIVINKTIDWDGRGGHSSENYKIVFESKEMLKELLLVYKKHLQEKLEGLIKEEN